VAASDCPLSSSPVKLCLASPWHLHHDQVSDFVGGAIHRQPGLLPSRPPSATAKSVVVFIARELRKVLLHKLMQQRLTASLAANSWVSAAKKDFKNMIDVVVYVLHKIISAE